MDSIDPHRWLTVAEAADLAGVTPDGMRKRLKRRARTHPECVRRHPDGRRWMVNPNELAKAVAADDWCETGLQIQELRREVAALREHLRRLERMHTPTIVKVAQSR